MSASSAVSSITTSSFPSVANEYQPGANKSDIALELIVDTSLEALSGQNAEEPVQSDIILQTVPQFFRSIWLPELRAVFDPLSSETKQRFYTLFEKCKNAETPTAQGDIVIEIFEMVEEQKIDFDSLHKRCHAQTKKILNDLTPQHEEIKQKVCENLRLIKCPEKLKFAQDAMAAHVNLCAKLFLSCHDNMFMGGSTKEDEEIHDVQIKFSNLRCTIENKIFEEDLFLNDYQAFFADMGQDLNKMYLVAEEKKTIEVLEGLYQQLYALSKAEAREVQDIMKRHKAIRELQMRIHEERAEKAKAILQAKIAE